MRSPTVFCSALAALLILPAHSIQGQATDTVRARAQALAPIVVTATKVGVPAVTASTTVLTGESLRRQGIVHVLDALREVPGLAVVQSGSFGGQTSLYSRGGGNGYTRVLVDGVPVNDPGGDFDFANLTTEAVDRIEIVRGPSSVLYGTDAVSGVIQIFTRTGDGPPRLTAGLRGGNYGTIDLDAGLRGGSGRTSYSFTARRFASDGIYPFNNENHRTALSGAIRFAPDSATDTRVTVHYADDDTHIPTDGSGAVVDHNAFQFGQRLTLGLDVGRKLTPRLEARLLVASYVTDGGFDDAQDSPADTLGFYASNGLDHVVRQSADLRANFTLRPNVVLTAGAVVESERERSFSESSSQFGPSTSAFVEHRRTHAGYGQLTGRIGAWSLNLSGRVDDNDAFGTFGTWRAGAALAVSPATSIRAAVGSAFREPTFFQNFASGFVRGNPNLEPEKATSWEVGFEQRLFADRLTLAGTWFDQRFRELIEFTFETASPTDPNYFNIAGAEARGIELEARAELPGGLTASAGHTWLDTKVLDAGFDRSGTGFFVAGAHLLRRPAHTTTAGLAWRVDRRADVAVRVLSFGRRDDIDYSAGQRVSLPSYTTVDLSATVDLTRWHRGGSGLSLTMRLANAFDQRYDAVLGFRSPGRTLLTGFDVVF